MLKNIFSHLEPVPTYIVNFLKADYKFSKYLFVGLFLLFSVIINYWTDFENSFLIQSQADQKLIRYLAFYGFAYFSGVLILRVYEKDWGYLKSPSFWLLMVVAIFIVSFNSSFKDYFLLARKFVDIKSYIYVGRLLSQFRYFITILFPLFVVWLFIRKRNDSFFGLTTQNIIVKPYLLLLAFMVPLILLAANSASFLTTYPTFRSYGTADYWNVSIGWLIATYELLYAFAFLSVELFFRGFLVIGLARIMGKDVILPMVCLYAFLHFGKPMGETIGSIFGGYILGVIAYYSKNIWGGVFVHAGVALLMELIAGLVKL